MHGSLPRQTPSLTIVAGHEVPHDVVALVFGEVREGGADAVGGQLPDGVVRVRQQPHEDAEPLVQHGRRDFGAGKAHDGLQRLHHGFLHADTGRRVVDALDELVDDRVHPRGEGHELAQAVGGSGAHGFGRVGQRLDERRLQLREERLHEPAALVDDDAEGVQDGALHLELELVGHDADEGPRDFGEERPQ